MGFEHMSMGIALQRFKSKFARSEYMTTIVNARAIARMSHGSVHEKTTANGNQGHSAVDFL